MKDKTEKPKYATPVIIPLGQVLTGLGLCSAGTNPGSGQGGGQCTAGNAASGNCTTGTLH